MSDDTPTGRFTPGDDDRPLDRSGADTPTERFDMSSELPPERPSEVPTERFDAVNAPGTDPTEYDATRIFDAAPEYPTELLGARAAAVPASIPGRPHTERERADARAAEPKARGLFFTLIGLAVVLLIAIIVLLVMAFGPRDDAPVTLPTDSATPSAPPSETPSAEPEPTPSETVAPPPPPPTPTEPVFDSFTAPQSSGCVEGEDEHPLTFSWSSANAVTAYVGIGTTEAQTSPFAADLPATHTIDNVPFDCTQASQVFTVTLENAEGLFAHESVTITR